MSIRRAKLARQIPIFRGGGCVKLIDVCKPKQWKTISTNELVKDGYPVFGANGIIGYFSDYNHEKPTLCITCRGATCGTVNKSLPYSYVTGNSMALDDLDESVIMIDFLYYFLQYRGFNDVITGSAQPQITRQSLSKIIIPDFDITIQKEIAQTIHDLEHLILIRNKQIEKLADLVKSRFNEMFGSKKFDKVSISELVDDRIETAKKIFDQHDTIKYIDISSIDNKNYKMTGFQEYMLNQAPSRAQQHIRKGDIVVSTVRPNLKNIAITELDDENLVASSGFCVLRALKCLPEYLFAIICSDRFTNKMTNIVTGANYPAIKSSDIMNYIVPLPPIQLQNEFAEFVAQVDKSQLAIQKSLEELETLKKSLMQEYFG